MAASSRHSALEGERGDRDFPSFVERPDEILLGHLHVVEKDLVEVMVPIHYDQRTHVDARRSHVVDDQVADALVLGSARIGAREQKHLVGILRAGCPDFRSVDNEVIALEIGMCLQAREIGTRARLGIALAPDIVAREDARQIMLFLLLARPLHKGRAEQADTGITGKDWCARPEIFLVEDDLLDQACRAPAVFLWPREPDPSGARELPLPCAPLLEYLSIGRDPLVHRVIDTQLLRQVLFEPGTNVLAKGFLFRREFEIHEATLPGSGATRATWFTCPNARGLIQVKCARGIIPKNFALALGRNRLIVQLAQCRGPRAVGMRVVGVPQKIVIAAEFDHRLERTLVAAARDEKVAVEILAGLHLQFGMFGV